MKLAICNELFEGWGWERVCDYVKSVGYEGLEVAPFTLSPRANLVSAEKRKELRCAAEKRGVAIVGLHWLLAKVEPADLYITHPEVGVRRRTGEYFKELVNLCADLGGWMMVIGSPKQRNLMAGVSREQALAYAAEVFSSCLDLAEKRGVTLAIEPLGPGETDFLLTAAEGIELIERVGHPNFRLHLDVKAMSSEKKGIAEIIRESGKHLAHFHANDPNLLGPGMGEVKFEPIVGALKEINYNGYLSVEVFDFKPGAERIASESAAYLRRMLSERRSDEATKRRSDEGSKDEF